MFSSMEFHALSLLRVWSGLSHIHKDKSVMQNCCLFTTYVIQVIMDWKNPLKNIACSAAV